MSYFLIFKNKDGHVIILEKSTLNDLYALITEHKMPEGTYRIIKGDKVV